jgi:hypothetical protein
MNIIENGLPRLRAYSEGADTPGTRSTEGLESRDVGYVAKPLESQTASICLEFSWIQMNALSTNASTRIEF